MTIQALNIPKKGQSPEQVLATLQDFKLKDPNWSDGRIFSLVYYLGEEHSQLLNKAYNLYMFENGLNMMAFQSLKKMETEILQMSTALLGGDENTVGTMTSGGTESILMAVKTYRDLKKVKAPEIIAPESAHVAFNKACDYFGVKMRRAKLNADFRVDSEHVKSLINDNTIAIVGSAPQYPQGVIDPIEELGKIALEKNIPLHVDACVGGFLLPFLEMNGVALPGWNFKVPGVTSISADLHKYGYAPKGASVVLYKHMKYLKHQFFIYENWSGGVYASATMPGTKSGGSIAGAWAVLNHFGEEGYKDLAKRTYEITQKFITGIKAISSLEIVGNPIMSVFAYKSKDKAVNIFAVGDEMQRRGWTINKQQNPECLHATITPIHEKSIEPFLKDLRESVEHIRLHPELAMQGQAAVYGMVAKAPMRGMVRVEVQKIMQKLYSLNANELAEDQANSEAAAHAPPTFNKRVLFFILNLVARFKKS
jgi:sphinganine-1-phosphate aldolase